MAARGICLDPEAGIGYELTAIAIVVIGGTTLNGGHGGIGLTVLGTLTIGYLEKILSINAVPEASRLMLSPAPSSSSPSCPKTPTELSRQAGAFRIRKVEVGAAPWGQGTGASRKFVGSPQSGVERVTAARLSREGGSGGTGTQAAGAAELGADRGLGQ